MLSDLKQKIEKENRGDVAMPYGHRKARYDAISKLRGDVGRDRRASQGYERTAIEIHSSASP
jgi:hypothetical protein